MKVSAKAEYACLAVLGLALMQQTHGPVRIADLAERNEIPERFLLQILLQLKGAGFVHSTRGAAGGYQLSVSPEQITIWDIVQLVDGPTNSSPDGEFNRSSGNRRILRKVWDTVNRAEELKLRQTDFGTLVKQATQQEAQMFHI